MAYDPLRFTETGTDRTLSLTVEDRVPDRDGPTPDRLGVHMVLEVLLLVGFAAVLFLFYRADSAPLSTDLGRQAVTGATVPLPLSGFTSDMTISEAAS